MIQVALGCLQYDLTMWVFVGFIVQGFGVVIVCEDIRLKTMQCDDSKLNTAILQPLATFSDEH